MNLIIDVGNTLIKLAVFKADKILNKTTCASADFEKSVMSCLENYPKINNGILASVGSLSANQVSFIQKKLPVLILNQTTKLPFSNQYKTPATLGVDRIALVSAAVKHFQGQNTLIIDAGTCITYDFITTKKQYLGGAISPGIKLRYTALHTLTANLPLLEKNMPSSIVGSSTEMAIHSGVIHGILLEIEGVIKKYHEKYSDLTVILTGGDANFLSKQLKSSIFANYNFLLEGLNHILQYNSNE